MGYFAIGNYTKKKLMICFKGAFEGALFGRPKI
jgi:hypothetical protein